MGFSNCLGSGSILSLWEGKESWVYGREDRAGWWGQGVDSISTGSCATGTGRVSPEWATRVGWLG